LLLLTDCQTDKPPSQGESRSHSLQPLDNSTDSKSSLVSVLQALLLFGPDQETIDPRDLRVRRLDDLTDHHDNHHDGRPAAFPGSITTSCDEDDRSFEFLRHHSDDFSSSHSFQTCAYAHHSLRYSQLESECECCLLSHQARLYGFSECGHTDRTGTSHVPNLGTSACDAFDLETLRTPANKID
jgi:hypothetical protein